MGKHCSFRAKYEKHCALYDTIPLGVVLENIEDLALELNADKLNSRDWNPLIDAIGSDKSLKYIAIRSVYRFENIKTRSSHLQPPIYEPTLLHRLCSGLASCISKNTNVHCFILQGLPLDKRDVIALAQGISENSSIQQLSLEGCSLLDEGIFKLVTVLRDKIDLFWLNVNSCGITEKGAIRLCDLVQSQSILRHSAAWADSLRYRLPSFGRMPGLRRLTMCNNMVGDRAALMFAERLKDDRWLRALDMQKCELTSTAALGFIEALQFNRSLVIVDIRQNRFVDSQLLSELKKALNRNAKLGLRDPLQVSWQWLGDQTPVSIGLGGTILSKGLDSTKSKRHESVRAYNCCKFGQRKQKSCIRRSKSLHGRVETFHVAGSHGDDDLEASPHYSYSQSITSPRREPLVDHGTNPSLDTCLYKKITQLQTLLNREIETRRRVEDRLRQVQRENSRLISEVTSLRGSVTPTVSIIPDEALEQVEQTIAQFHNFLDFLRDKGMSTLVREGLEKKPQCSLNGDILEVVESVDC